MGNLNDKLNNYPLRNKYHMYAMFYFRIFRETLVCYEDALEGCTNEELVEMGVYDTWVDLQDLVDQYCSW